MKKSKSQLFIILLIFGLYVTGLGNMLIQKQNTMVCIDSDDSESINTEDMPDEVFFTYTATKLNIESIATRVHFFGNMNLLLEYEVSFFEIVAQPPEVLLLFCCEVKSTINSNLFYNV